MVGEDGLVFEKNFVAEHGRRESANDMPQESLRVEHLDRGQTQIVTTPHLTASAYFAAPTIRPNQLTVLTVEIAMVDGIHINARSLPEGYTPVELTLDSDGGLVLERVSYPEPERLFLEALDETLQVYTDKAKIKAHCRSVTRGQAETLQLTARLTYQACDDRTCFLPQTLTLTLPLESLPHVA